ncbi:unnamed protein product [Gongylonema pulchrum]|uniref:MARVEL domain-containing protein n=1 Tax=Gongylonema pulchrum TaxID=637853 RepID=A0A3P6R384_9BILA|nr:unnamed protein product [Gongylonema pulchrum]
MKSIFQVVGFAQWIAVSRGGWYKPKDGDKEICIYANSSTTCSFASAMGFFAILSAVGLLFLDAKFEKISSVPTRKRAVTADMILSAVLAFLFLITFFSLWLKYGDVQLEQPFEGGTAKSAIIFALLSTVAWVKLLSLHCHTAFNIETA